MYDEYGITQEEYEIILDEYGDVNEETIRQYYESISLELSKGIKKEVNKHKEITTEFMDNTKLLFFTGLLLGYGYARFKDKLEDNYRNYKKEIESEEEKGFDFVSKYTRYLEDYEYTNQQEIQLNELMSLFELDKTSTKTADDRYIRIIENYYRNMESSVKYYKEKDLLETYLSKYVSKFDKLEKTVAYYNKDGTIRAYFDIASYDSMVYNTNLAREGTRASIRRCIQTYHDVIYVDPHEYACPECQIWQGKFYSLSGETTFFNGYEVLPFDMALEGESGIGLLHPNCKHVPRPAYYFDKPSSKYSSPEWIEEYDKQQKIQGLKLKRKRLKNDNKIYKELEDQSSIDENNKRIRSINEKIRELSQ